ncbi:transglutaminaseTgpA domain-containing protein [Frankia sp. AgPm24]|uniref:transglutaminaseTgpA domain-containing protein n=1 Tax=Frankia sp. AgPm24 TaxID=631128 RepID=UPI00200F8260|nr:transglutaminaseTgpA domain-containing protein [Frankia sp. AgPm24]MCK9922359.1 transglutaminaseTgpA domain-containing protein [Frankia sp. AgPm24]
MNRRFAPTAVTTVACLLSSSALSRLFDGTRWWLVPVVIAVLVAVVTATVSRLLRLPTVAGLVISLAGLAVTVTLLCARGTALLGLIPTPLTVSTLRDLIADGSSDISRLATPVPHRPGLVVLIVLGVYLTTMLVELIVVTLERPTLGGLPLLALYAVSAAILPGGVGALAFGLGAVSFVALLLLDGRLAIGRWGRPVATSTGAGADGSAGEPPRPRVAVTALGVSLAALVVAVTLPLALPSLDGSGLVSRRSGYGAGDGPSSASVVQPIVSVSQQLHADATIPLLRVRTETPRYLRLTALENFDGQLFTLRALNATRDDRVSEGLPKPQLGGTTSIASAEVTISDRFNELYLPVPGIPTKIKGLVGDWRLADPTGTIFSTRTSTAGVRYQVEAVSADPTRAQLLSSNGRVPADLAVDTLLPANLDGRLRTLLATLTQGAATTYEKVYAIQEYLRGPTFTYDLQGAPTTQDGALAAFLFDTHRGYCEQFASAMTVLVRMMGIPARVAIGFVPGEQQPDGTYLVTNRQAHAWPEVWFPSVGWLGFEPTRRADGATTAPSYAPAGVEDPDAALAPGPQTQVAPEPDPSTGSGQDPSAAPTATATDGASDTAADAPHRATGGGFPWWAIVLLVAAGPVLLALAVPGLIRLRRRRTRLRPGRHAGGADAASGAGAHGSVDQVHDAWSELLDVAADLGVTIRPSDSPRTGVARLSSYLDAEPTPGGGPVRAKDSPAISGSPAPDEPGPDDDLTPDAAPSLRYAQAREALGRLAAAEERARYAPQELASPPPPAEITRDVLIASDTLWSIAPRARRIMARLAPASVLYRAPRPAASPTPDAGIPTEEPPAPIDPHHPDESDIGRPEPAISSRR